MSAIEWYRSWKDADGPLTDGYMSEGLRRADVAIEELLERWNESLLVVNGSLHYMRCGTCGTVVKAGEAHSYRECWIALRERRCGNCRFSVHGANDEAFRHGVTNPTVGWCEERGGLWWLLDFCSRWESEKDEEDENR